MHQIPKELLSLTLSYSVKSYRDLLKYRGISREWNIIVDESLMWFTCELTVTGKEASKYFADRIKACEVNPSLHEYNQCRQLILSLPKKGKHEVLQWSLEYTKRMIKSTQQLILKTEISFYSKWNYLAKVTKLFNNLCWFLKTIQGFSENYLGLVIFALFFAYFVFPSLIPSLLNILVIGYGYGFYLEIMIRLLSICKRYLWINSKKAVFCHLFSCFLFLSLLFSFSHDTLTLRNS
jgi:hypothetical protein